MRGRLRWLVVIDARTLDSPSPSSTDAEPPVVRKWSPGGCVWCGSRHDVEPYRDEPRCADCRAHESVVDAARRFIGMYGLRPLGGAVDSEDDEELDHRTAARDARAALDRSRLPKRPGAADVRKASTRSAGSAPSRTSTPSRASAPTRPSTSSRTSAPTAAVSGVDVSSLGDRVSGLLDQLGAIDAGIADARTSGGLPARARLSDLERQRATVMTTLAALEKARRASSD